MARNTEWATIFERWSLDRGFKLEGSLGRLTEHGEKLLQYLERWNQAYNLVAPSTLTSYWETHWLDSLKGLFFITSTEIVDFGTGAGFPVLPLCLCNKGFKAVCIEKRAKKRAFVKDTAAALGIADRIKILPDISEYEGGWKDADLISRAVSLEDVVSFTKNLPPRRWIYWGVVDILNEKKLLKQGYSVSQRDEELRMTVLERTSASAAPVF